MNADPATDSPIDPPVRTDSELAPASDAQPESAAGEIEHGADFEPAAERAIWGMRVSALITALAFASAPILGVLLLLGDGAAWALKAAITQFRDEFVQHVEEGRCPYH